MAPVLRRLIGPFGQKTGWYGRSLFGAMASVLLLGPALGCRARLPESGAATRQGAPRAITEPSSRASPADVAFGGSSHSKTPIDEEDDAEESKAKPKKLSSKDRVRLALEELLESKPKTRTDRYETLRIPLADGADWERVRIWTVPTRAAFRYGGDNRYAMDALFYVDRKGDSSQSACLQYFWDRAMDVSRRFAVKFDRVSTERVDRPQSKPSEAPKTSNAATASNTTTPTTALPVLSELASRPLLVKKVDGSMLSFTGRTTYVGAIVAYPSFPGTCLLRAAGFEADDHRALAEKVRDRWVSDIAPDMVWRPTLQEVPKRSAK